MSLPQYLYDWEEAYLIASAVLIGILMLFIVLFACLSLVKARSGNVAILRFVPWMKAAFWIFSLCEAHAIILKAPETADAYLGLSYSNSSMTFSSCASTTMPPMQTAISRPR